MISEERLELIQMLNDEPPIHSTKYFTSVYEECEELIEEFAFEYIQEDGNDSNSEEKKKGIIKRIVEAIKKMIRSIQDAIKSIFSKKKFTKEELQEEVPVDKTEYEKEKNVLTAILQFLTLPVKQLVETIQNHKKAAALIATITTTTVGAIFLHDKAKNKATRVKRGEILDEIQKCNKAITKADANIDYFTKIYEEDSKLPDLKKPKKSWPLGKKPTKAELDRYEAMKGIRENRLKDSIDNIAASKKEKEELMKARDNLLEMGDRIPRENYNTFLKAYKTIMGVIRGFISSLSTALHFKGGDKDGETAKNA